MSRIASKSLKRYYTSKETKEKLRCILCSRKEGNTVFEKTSDIDDFLAAEKRSAMQLGSTARILVVYYMDSVVALIGLGQEKNFLVVLKEFRISELSIIQVWQRMK